MTQGTTGEGQPSPTLSELVDRCQESLLSLARLGVEVDQSIGFQVEFGLVVEWLFAEGGPFEGRLEEFRYAAASRLAKELEALRARAGQQRLHVPGMPPTSHVR